MVPADIAPFLWPFVVLILVLVFAGPVRRLVRAVAEKVQTSERGELGSKWASFAWGEKVGRVLESLERVPEERTLGQAKGAINNVRLPASGPSDLINEAHEGVLVVLKGLFAPREVPREDQEWLAPYAEVLIEDGVLSGKLAQAIYVLDDLFAIARRASEQLDAANAEEYVRLAESVLRRLPKSPPAQTTSRAKS